MKCRGCGGSLNPDHVFCDLGAQPLANALLEDPNMAEATYPLRPLVCEHCLLVQLPDCPRPKQIFTDGYPFYSGQSGAWLTHCKELADDLIQRFGLDSSSHVLDIGSNDGSMLRPFRGAGISAVGVEPCHEVAEHALKEGLPTILDWWSADTAERLRSMGRDYRADLVVCTNVLAHVPDLQDFLAGIHTILAPDGWVLFEVPYVGNLIEECQFDQIYAEHHCYFSVHSLHAALLRSHLAMQSVELVPVHGGSLRVLAQLVEMGLGKSAQTALQTEASAGLRNLDTYLDFAKEPPQLKRRNWHALVYHRDHRIVGYGASAKAAVTCNYLGIGPEWIEFVADTTPSKQGKYLPGSRIPVVSPRALEQAQPDVVVNFAWNWAKEAEANIRKACPHATVLYLRDDVPARVPA